MHIAPEYDTTNPIALRLERRVESFIDRKGGAALDRELLLDARTAIVDLMAALQLFLDCSPQTAEAADKMCGPMTACAVSAGLVAMRKAKGGA